MDLTQELREFFNECVGQGKEGPFQQFHDGAKEIISRHRSLNPQSVLEVQRRANHFINTFNH